MLDNLLNACNHANAAGELATNVGRNFMHKISPRRDYCPDLSIVGKVFRSNNMYGK